MIFTAIYIILFLMFVYFTMYKKDMYAALIYIIFATKGLTFVPTPPNLNQAFPLLSLFIYCLVNFKSIMHSIKHKKLVRKAYHICLFFIISIMFSIVYWRRPIYEAVHEGLPYMTFMCIVLFSRLTKQELRKLTKWLFYITFITTIVFVIQSITGIPLLANTWDTDMDMIAVVGGLHRFYSAPTFINYFIFISIFDKELIPKYLRVIAPITFLAARFCTMHRSAIMATMAGIALCMWLSGSIRKNFKVIFVFGVIFLLFGSAFEERVKSGNNSTSRDLAALMSGNFDLVGVQDTGSLTLMYRVGWFIERGVYLLNHPVELMMGMPLSHNKEYLSRRYNFKLGLIDPKDGYKEQVTTPDIGYGMMETRYGVIGSIFLIGMILYIYRWLFRNMHKSDLVMSLLGVFVTHTITTLAGTGMADPQSWVTFFFMFEYAQKIVAEKRAFKLASSPAVIAPNRLPELA